MATLRIDTRNKVTWEDMALGNETVTQERGGQPVVLTEINAANFPYNAVQSLQSKIDETAASKFAFMAINERGHMIATYAEANLFSFSARGHLLIHYTPEESNEE